MGESLGQMAIAENHDGMGYGLLPRPEYSEETARQVDEEIKRILKEAYDRAIEVLREHRDGLDRVAKDLLEKEEIPGKEVLALVGVARPQVPLEEVISGSGSS
jgi:cell division protease FtsH